jgi:hypothetical protein
VDATSRAKIDVGAQTGHFYLAILKAALKEPPSPAAILPPTSSRRSSCSPAIESAITGEVQGWSGETIFKLDNGQIWQQAEHIRSTCSSFPSLLYSASQALSCFSSRPQEIHLEDEPACKPIEFVRVSCFIECRFSWSETWREGFESEKRSSSFQSITELKSTRKEDDRICKGISCGSSL